MTKITSGLNSEKIFYIFLILLVILLLYSFYSKLESHLVEEDKGYQGEAVTNDYLAAEYFLLRMGQSAEKIKLFSTNQQILNKDDILLVPGVRLSFDRRRTDEILSWVKSGGHLIVTGEVSSEKLTEHKDYLLNALGLIVDRKALEAESDQSEYPVNITSLDDETFLQVDFDDYLVVSKTAEFNSKIYWTAKDEDRMHAIQIEVDEGRLTLLSDMRMLTNDYIDAYDHAAFLLSLIEIDLAQTNLTPSQLLNDVDNIFYYSLFEVRLSLLQWLWENAYLLLLSCLLLIACALWMMIPRFGPLINIDAPIRRQFLNHLSAAGNYHWRQGNYVHMLSDVRTKLSHEIKIKYPEWVSLTKQDQVAHFSEISQMDNQQVEMALFNTDIQHVNDFVTIIKLLEILRKKL